jgi:hypothetical protein
MNFNLFLINIETACSRSRSQWIEIVCQEDSRRVAMRMEMDGKYTAILIIDSETLSLALSR